MRDISLSGGKGSGLCRVSELPGIAVPEGVIVTTEANRAFIKPVIRPLLEQIECDSDKVRRAIRQIPLPKEFVAELRESLATYDSDVLFAVRSSATAEDLPDASFAGQQDSYLNVSAENVRQAVLDCFASLFNDRAVAYREKHGFAHKDVSMAVVIQCMVPAQVSGVLFTADPMTSDRRTCVLEAVEGLGEELVTLPPCLSDFLPMPPGRCPDNCSSFEKRNPETFFPCIR